MIIKEKSESSLVHTVCVSAILSGANTFIHAIRSCFDKDMHKPDLCGMILNMMKPE